MAHMKIAPGTGDDFMAHPFPRRPRVAQSRCSSCTVDTVSPNKVLFVYIYMYVYIYMCLYIYILLIKDVCIFF